MWPFKKKPRTSKQVLADLREWADSQLKAGKSRQFLETTLLKAKLDAKDPEYAAKLQANSLLAREIGNLLYQRNEQGSAYEKAGDIDQAIALYEQNVADEFMGGHPYERLRILYSQRKDYANALRICQAAVACPYLDKKKKEKFQEWVKKLAEKGGLTTGVQ
jgi:tetratricopeptide (TPR) repeat protein